MISFITTAPCLLALLLSSGLIYGQDNPPQSTKQGAEAKLFPRDVKDLPNFTPYGYSRSPRDPFLDKSVKSTILGEYKDNLLDKLVLVSWLDDAGEIVIFVQNTETNDVQRVTYKPNKDHFQIVEIHPNADPKLFEAVISNGTEKGPVRFRLAPPPGQNPQTGTPNPQTAQTKKPQIPTFTPPPSAQKKN
jgi:hypothetical protein